MAPNLRRRKKAGTKIGTKIGRCDWLEGVPLAEQSHNECATAHRGHPLYVPDREMSDIDNTPPQWLEQSISI